MTEDNLFPQIEPIINESLSQQIPEDLFIQKNENPKMNDPVKKENNSFKREEVQSVEKQTLIEQIFTFLRQDFNSTGYSDALTMPDMTYMEDQIEQIIGQYHLLLAEAKFNYEKHVNDIEFFIQSRERIGLMDVADELKTKKGNVIKDLEFILSQSQKLTNREGEIKNVMNSYKSGFRKGLAALAFGNALRDI
jgi:hypothetical protein